MKKVLGIEITNPSKIIYPKEKVTKLDVANYYAGVAKFMLPFLDKRLISVIRCHQGIDGKCFFKKHPTTETEHIKPFKLKGDKEEYFYLYDEVGIVNQAQMGTVEFHFWASNVLNIDKPDIMTFDLDPDKNVSIDKLRDAVLNLKTILDSLNLKAFLKTSGGKGYHILVPFASNCGWEEFEKFAKNVALLAELKWANIFTTNIRKENRDKKIFVDYLRNGKGATCVCPFSLRAREGAKISMPIQWEDLEKIKPNDVNIFNFKEYLKISPWKNFFKNKQKIFE